MNSLYNLIQFTPTVSAEFKDNCDKPISNTELVEALKHMEPGKAPGIDGLSTEFYSSFWDIIETPLLNMYKECIENNEMSTTMKQGLINLIPKPNFSLIPDPLLVEYWRPITLLNTDYKLFALVFARRLKKDLAEIISETQTGFMANRHIL